MCVCVSRLTGLSFSVGGTPTTAPPIEYTMMLHPPLVVENLLPHAGSFELVDQVRKSEKNKIKRAAAAAAGVLSRVAVL